MFDAFQDINLSCMLFGDCALTGDQAFIDFNHLYIGFKHIVQLYWLLIARFGLSYFVYNMLHTILSIYLSVTVVVAIVA